MVPATSKLPWYAFRWKTIGWTFFWTLLPYSLIVFGLYRFGRSLRFSLRTFMIGATLAALFVGYVGTYYRLSRRGMQEATTVGLESCFLYVPFSEAALSHDLTRHHRLAAIYAPLNALDRALFKGTHPVQNITWVLAD